MRTRESLVRVAGTLGWLLPTFAVLVAAHWPLLRLPYYWDEAGYYIPAAYDFLRRGTLIPYSTLSNAHPPLLSIYLASWWSLFGFSPFVTRTAMCLAAAVALAAVYRLARRQSGDRTAAAATTLLTALYPVWFVQSTLAHADLLAAAGTLWGLCLLLASDSGTVAPDPHAARPGFWPATVCFALAALSKEIAIGTPLALAAWELSLAWRARVEPAVTTSSREARQGRHLRTALALLIPALPLAGWFAYHRWRTGFTFGNPEYLRYNATATLTPLRVAFALMHRALHLTAHLNLFVPVVVTLGCLLLPKRADRQPIRPAAHAQLLVVLLANWVFFSVLGGALLTRYLLPLYPLVLLLCVDAWRQHLSRAGMIGLAGLSAAAFVLGLFVNPPYRFAPEDTLAYRDSILLEQSGIAQIEARYGRPTVLTAWPATDGLTKPELGYVQHPLPVVSIDNFSYPQVRMAQTLAGKEIAGSEPYTVALVFSTKYDPPGRMLEWSGWLGRKNQALDERYFAFHQDLPPETIARLLGGEVVWHERRHGQWAAVLHFSRPQLALLAPGARPGSRPR